MKSENLFYGARVHKSENKLYAGKKIPAFSSFSLLKAPMQVSALVKL